MGYPYSIYGRGYGLNKYKYGQYGLRNGLGHRNYGRNYLRHGYKNSYNRRLYYDEENQDASPYYPKNHGNFQYGKYSYRFGNYRYGKYGRGYGFGRYGGKNGLRYGRFGKKYVGHGYRKGHIGKPYYDEEEQDPSRYYPVKPGPHQRGKSSLVRPMAMKLGKLMNYGEVNALVKSLVLLTTWLHKVT